VPLRRSAGLDRSSCSSASPCFARVGHERLENRSHEPSLPRGSVRTLVEATGLVRPPKRTTSPLRDSAGFAPDFAATSTGSLAPSAPQRCAQLGQSLRLHHYRDAAFHEIDLVIERSDSAVVTVEISATDSPQPVQLSHLAWRQGLAPFAPACCSTPALVRPDPPTASTRGRCRPSGIRRSTETPAAFEVTNRPWWPRQWTGRCEQQVIPASSRTALAAGTEARAGSDEQDHAAAAHCRKLREGTQSWRSNAAEFRRCGNLWLAAAEICG